MVLFFIALKSSQSFSIGLTLVFMVSLTGIWQAFKAPKKGSFERNGNLMVVIQLLIICIPQIFHNTSLRNMWLSMTIIESMSSLPSLYLPSLKFLVRRSASSSSLHCCHNHTKFPETAISPCAMFPTAHLHSGGTHLSPGCLRRAALSLPSL